MPRMSALSSKSDIISWLMIMQKLMFVRKTRKLCLFLLLLVVWCCLKRSLKCPGHCFKKTKAAGSTLQVGLFWAYHCSCDNVWENPESIDPMNHTAFGKKNLNSFCRKGLQHPSGSGKFLLSSFSTPCPCPAIGNLTEPIRTRLSPTTWKPNSSRHMRRIWCFLPSVRTICNFSPSMIHWAIVQALRGRLSPSKNLPPCRIGARS